MEITLRFHFEDIPAWCGHTNDPDDYHRGEIVVDYDYQVPIDLQTIKDYMIYQIGYYTFKSWSKDKQYGYMRAIEVMFESDFFFPESFSENEDFMKWIKEQYEEEAHECCEGEYR